MIYSMIIVDCQNDFISGTLACKNAEEAVEQIIEFLNEQNDLDVFYSLDWHSPYNKSYKDNGGIWPVHCLQDTEGAKLEESFYSDVERSEFRPQPANLYYKGQDDEDDGYSAFEAVNEEDKILKDQIRQHVIVCGIATEFCVKETVLQLLEAEHSVSILTNGLGYVNEESHEEVLKELEAAGADLI